jgi:hypothetical protein
MQACFLSRTLPMLPLAALALFLSLSPAAAQSSCAAELTRWQTVLERDLKTGNVAKSVHDRAMADIAAIRPVCQSGQDAQAMRQITAAKAKYGYR